MRAAAAVDLAEKAEREATKLETSARVARERATKLRREAERLEAAAAEGLTAEEDLDEARKLWQGFKLEGGSDLGGGGEA